MVSRGGRCLCSVLILTGFLLAATNGETTSEAPTTAPVVVQTTPSVTTAETTTLDLTTPDIDDCASMPCKNEGTCTDGTNSYTCDCTGTGYNGTDCTIDINECLRTDADYPCDADNGDCTNTLGSYICTCNPGFETDSSDPSACSDIDECLRTDADYPCDAVNGNCTNTLGSYNCTCNSGFETDSSDPSACSNINDCFEGACQNGGTCTDLVNDFNCSCPTGFNGTQCEFDIDACEPEPCENEGNCTNHLMNSGDANFTCLCMPGWTGRNCSEDIRECESTPCQNNGTCFEATNYYNCTCLPGFNGSYCEHKCPEGTFGDYCTESCTCVDGANCSNVDGSCTCEPAFEGAVCNRSEVKVTAYRTSNDTISKDKDFTLACQVNLAGIDLVEVAWYRDSVDSVESVKLPGTTDVEYRVDSDPDMGMYNITILKADAVDTGAYRCTAMTKGNRLNASSEAISVDVVVRGQIDLVLSKLEDRIQLNQTASLNCTVFSSSDASIAWERNGVRLVDGTNRTSIQPSQEIGKGGTYFFSVLKISDIAREDNGAYKCLAFDGAGNMTDSADFNIFVQEVAELANPEYDNVLSMQLQLVWDFTVQGNDDNITCTAKYGIQDTNETEQDVGGTSPGVPVTYLEPYTTYKFLLICVNLAGSSKPLVFPPQRTLAGKPSQPLNVQTGDVRARQVYVEWDEPMVKNGPIDGYYLTVEGGIEDLTYTTLGSRTSTILDELTPYTTYRISIQAFNNNAPELRQFSVKSSSSEPFTTSEAVPGEPGGITVDNAPTECIISWTPPMEPNGDIIKYTLYIEILKMGTDVVDKREIKEVPGTQLEITFMKAELAPFSIFRYSITASTEPGEGDDATTTTPCTTPQGVPVAPPSIPTPNEEAISQTSFTTTLPPYDARNGPVSCCEVIVVELEDGDANLDSSLPSYDPGQIKSYEEAKNTKGTPYSAVVYSNCPTDGATVVIGATTDDESTCHTGGSAGSANRRRRQTTGASSLTAVNGPLNPGGIYSSFVRVYTPTSEDSEMAFYQSGPFMTPVTLKPTSNVPAIVGGVFGFLIIMCLVIVIGLIYIRRQRDYSNDPLMTPTSNGPRENGNGTIIGLQNLGIDDAEHDIVVKPIKLENLEKTIRQKAQEEKRIFWAEYKALPNRPPPLATMNHSNLPPNKDKNRYINIIAYDHTRVKLKPTDGIEGSDYINASYVNGYQSPDKFIAAQGPKDNTLEDFWRMIWEYNCSTIVMLTKCIEDGKDKCSQYWPNKGVIKYGRFKVKMDSVTETAEYVIRSFQLSEDGKETGQRSITQFHFLGWPDHGQPDYPSPMMCLIKRVRHLTSKMNHRANIVVHCSAGVGRTGTYIVIDAMLDMMKHEKQVDIYNFIHDIRQQRNTLVQSFVQYFFIHMALLEEHLFGHSDVAMPDFPAYYQQLSNKSDFDEDLTQLEVEFRRACKLGVNGTDQSFANIDQNKDKNRIGHILPFDKNVVKLERLIGEEFSDYINASFITGYQRKNMYIATQGPLPNTIADFWRMIWESQTSTIVMLTEISQKGHEMCAQYWPLEIDETEEQGDISVTLVEESEEDDDFTVRDIEISHAHMMQNIYGNTDAAGEVLAEGADIPESDSQTALYGNVESPPPTPMKDIRKIRQYHFRGWPEVGVPESGIDLMRLVNKSHLHQKEQGPKPIVVHCSAGSGRTGVFIALNVLMSRMEEESMIDVFQTVRGLRQQRPHMVQDLAQFKFCYSAMVEYLEEQSTEYQNFVPRV